MISCAQVHLCRISFTRLQAKKWTFSTFTILDFLKIGNHFLLTNQNCRFNNTETWKLNFKNFYGSGFSCKDQTLWSIPVILHGTEIHIWTGLGAEVHIKGRTYFRRTYFVAEFTWAEHRSLRTDGFIEKKVERFWTWA